MYLLLKNKKRVYADKGQQQNIIALKKIAKDKWNHFLIGIPLGVVVQLACYYLFPFQLLYVSLISFAVLLSGCYAFELYSLITRKGHYELLDVAAGVVGALIGMAICCLFLI